MPRRASPEVPTAPVQGVALDPAARSVAARGERVTSNRWSASHRLPSVPLAIQGESPGGETPAGRA